MATCNMSMKIEACYEVEYKDKSVDIWDLESTVSDDADIDAEIDKMFDAEETKVSKVIDRVWLLWINVDGEELYGID